MSRTRPGHVRDVPHRLTGWSTASPCASTSRSPAEPSAAARARVSRRPLVASQSRTRNRESHPRLLGGDRPLPRLHAALVRARRQAAGRRRGGGGAAAGRKAARAARASTFGEPDPAFVPVRPAERGQWRALAGAVAGASCRPSGARPSLCTVCTLAVQSSPVRGSGSSPCGSGGR